MARSKIPLARVEALDLLEHIEIHRLIEQRKRKGIGKRISLDALLKEQHIAAIDKREDMAVYREAVRRLLRKE